MAMYATFIRSTPVVTGSAVYSDKSVNLYLQMSGYAHNAVIIEIVMDKQQVDKSSASPPVSFDFAETEHPLCPFDRVTFYPFQSLPPRNLQDRTPSAFSGNGRYILWCGRFQLRHGPPNVLRIPCKRPLDESPQIGIRYRYRVGTLLAEEYQGIKTAEMGRQATSKEHMINRGDVVIQFQ